MSDFAIPRVGPRLDPGVAEQEAVAQPPNAEFTHAITSGSTVAFTNLSTDPDGTIVAYEWDFDEFGGAGPPAASFRFTVNGTTVTFTNQSTAVPPKTIASYLWAFGDGTTSTAQHPIKTYATAGTYMVSLQVTDSAGLTDTDVASVQVGNPVLGRPWGLLGGFETSSSLYPNQEPMTLVSTPNQPNTIISMINVARNQNKQILLIMTGGGHDKYWDENRVFDLEGKWKPRQALFFTTAIKAAIAAGVADGTVVGCNMIDEPANTTERKGWGGSEGVLYITRAMLDEMANYIKAQFPTLPCGIFMDYTSLLKNDPGPVFASVDFQLSFYVWRKNASQTDYRDEALAYYATQNLAPVFGFNPVAGGFQYPKDPAALNCPQPYTGGFGTDEPTSSQTCAMNATQYKEWCEVFLRGSRGVVMWTYRLEYFARSDIKASSVYLGNLARTLSRSRWSLRS